jgi:hypothetical protein
MEETAFSSPLEVGIGKLHEGLGQTRGREQSLDSTRKVGHSNQVMLLEHCIVVSRK